MLKLRCNDAKKRLVPLFVNFFGVDGALGRQQRSLVAIVYFVKLFIHYHGAAATEPVVTAIKVHALADVPGRLAQAGFEALWN